MSTGGLVLNKILIESDLNEWTRLKPEYFSADLKPIYRSVAKFYHKHSRLPTFEELDLLTRNNQVKNCILLLRAQEVPEDISTELAVDALVDEFVQNKTLDQLDNFLESITILDAEEVVDNLQNIVLELEEITHTNSEVETISDVEIFEEENDLTFIPLNLNNTMDQVIIGAAKTELWGFGGYRGHGKSLVCSNLQVNEYVNGYVAPYFTIEMRPVEIIKRNIAIQTGVDALRLRNNLSTPEERLKIAKCMAEKYVDGEAVYEEFLRREDRFWFERELKKLEKKEPVMPTIYNPQMSIVDIDVHLQKFKARYGDKLRMAIVDYINKIQVPGNKDPFDWKIQTTIADMLKRLAGKYDILIVAPYQIDKEGGARFAKGILDSVDAAVLLESWKPARDSGSTVGYMNFSTDDPNAKVRSLPPFSVRSYMDWGSLKIDPSDYVEPTEEGGDENEGIWEE